MIVTVVWVVYVQLMIDDGGLVGAGGKLVGGRKPSHP